CGGNPPPRQRSDGPARQPATGRLESPGEYLEAPDMQGRRTTLLRWPAGRFIGRLSRRLACVAVLAMAAAMPAGAGEVCSPQDAARCQALLDRAAAADWASLPMGETVVAVGRALLGVPYKASSLERPGPEALVVDLAGLDCTTYV